MKFNIEQIQATLEAQKIDQPKIAAVIHELEQVAQEEAEEKEANKLPKLKHEYTIIVNDPEGKITEEFDGWVVTSEESVDKATIISRLRDAAKEQNEAAKRKKNKLTTLGEVFEGIKTKFLKDKKVKVKTKISVRVLTVNGKQF